MRRRLRWSMLEFPLRWHMRENVFSIHSFLAKRVLVQRNEQVEFLFAELCDRLYRDTRERAVDGRRGQNVSDGCARRELRGGVFTGSYLVGGRAAGNEQRRGCRREWFDSDSARCGAEVALVTLGDAQATRAARLPGYKEYIGPRREASPDRKSLTLLLAQLAGIEEQGKMRVSRIAICCKDKFVQFNTSTVNNWYNIENVLTKIDDLSKGSLSFSLALSLFLG